MQINPQGRQGYSSEGDLTLKKATASASSRVRLKGGKLCQMRFP
jgi:hypothetical protein